MPIGYLANISLSQNNVEEVPTLAIPQKLLKSFQRSCRTLSICIGNDFFDVCFELGPHPVDHTAFFIDLSF